MDIRGNLLDRCIYSFRCRIMPRIVISTSLLENWKGEYGKVTLDVKRVSEISALPGTNLFANIKTSNEYYHTKKTR